MHFSKLTYPLLLVAVFAIGCADDGDALLEDCEGCDIAAYSPTYTELIGLQCERSSFDITCAAPGDGKGGIHEFEGIVSVKSAPSYTSDRVFVATEELHDGFKLDLGWGYEPGTAFELSISGSSYYLEDSDDWIPFTLSMVVPGDESKYFEVKLPFRRWSVPVIARVPLEVSYAISGDSSIRTVLGRSYDKGITATDFLLPTDATTVVLDLGGEAGKIEMPVDEGPWIVEWSVDVPSVRVATQGDLSF